MLPKTMHISNTPPQYPNADVVDQLNLILSHDLFKNSPVLSNFLKYIVEETLEGNLTYLKEYTIGVNGLGKKADFDPQTDAVVRIHAGRLRRLLTEYYEGPGKRDKILIEVIKGSYVPVFSERYARQEKPNMLSLDGIKHVEISKVTLAILPFRNLSPGNDHQYFVDGLGEELTRVFSAAGEFFVVGHHSTLKLSLHHINLHTIGVKLNAQYVITGTVMRGVNHFRINVGLVETHMSTQIWSKAFDYDFDVDIMVAMDQTIQSVHALLGGQFGFIVRHRATIQKPTLDNPIEFDPAIWNYNFHINFSFFNYIKTRRVLEIVQQNDTQSPGALAMLSELYLWGHILGYPTAENPVGTSLQLAQKAMSLDPTRKDAYFSFFWAFLYSKGKEAIEHEIGHFQNMDKLSPTEAGKLGMTLVCSGHYERARILVEQSIKRNAHYPWSFDLALSLIHFREDQYVQALEAINRIHATDVYLVDLMKIILLGRIGLGSEARSFVDLFLQNHPIPTLNLKAHLGTFLLDDGLVDRIVEEARSAGVLRD